MPHDTDRSLPLSLANYPQCRSSIDLLGYILFRKLLSCQNFKCLQMLLSQCSQMQLQFDNQQVNLSGLTLSPVLRCWFCFSFFCCFINLSLSRALWGEASKASGGLEISEESLNKSLDSFQWFDWDPAQWRFKGWENRFRECFRVLAKRPLCFLCATWAEQLSEPQSDSCRSGHNANCVIGQINYSLLSVQSFSIQFEV